MSDDPADRLRTAAADPLKARFVGRDEVVDLIALAVVAGEHLFLFGPPGTAKSLLVREFASAVRCRYFEYLLTRFSEPNELFGPVDLARLREGVVATVVTGMLPEAEFAFLDELFNANSAILNNLLTVLNERVYRRGTETHRLPLVSAFAASNHLPEDDALQALFDRFLLRCKVDSLPRPQLPALLAAGWAIERDGKPVAADGPSADDLRALGRRAKEVELGGVLEAYADAVGKARDLGVALSDRRAVKVLKLVAASAVLSGRTAANASDLWVLRYVWDRVEQIGPLGAMVTGILDAAGAVESPHPRAARPEQVDAEGLARELDQAEVDLTASPKLAELARLRERVQAAADRAAWVGDAAGRDHLLSRAGGAPREDRMTPADPWHDVTAARIPAAGAAALGPVRYRADVRVIPDGNRLWVRWPAGRADVVRCLLPVAGVVFLTWRGGTWFPFGSRLPTADRPPDGDGASVASVLSPARFTPVDAGKVVAPPVVLRAVRGGEPRPVTALRCRLADLADWAEHATTAELSAVTAARAGGRIVLRGAKLPTVPGGTRFWGDDVLVPVGFRAEPDLRADVLRAAAGADRDELVVIDEAGAEVIPLDAFRSVTRPGLRLAV